jgi:hypothetical protein
MTHHCQGNSIFNIELDFPKNAILKKYMHIYDSYESKHNLYKGTISPSAVDSWIQIILNTNFPNSLQWTEC